jgi:hypothetical protein
MPQWRAKRPSTASNPKVTFVRIFMDEDSPIKRADKVDPHTINVM